MQTLHTKYLSANPRRVAVIAAAATYLLIVVVLGLSSLHFWDGMFLPDRNETTRGLGYWLTLIFGVWCTLFGSGAFVFGCWRVLWNMFVMATNTNDLISEASFLIRWNRLNTLFAPKYLSDSGRQGRKRVFSGLKIVVGGVLHLLFGSIISMSFICGC